MKYYLNIGGEIISIHSDFNIRSLFSEDPFFLSALVYTTFYNTKPKGKIYNFGKYNYLFKNKKTYSHIPFFLLSFLGNILYKKGSYILHGATLSYKDTIILITGNKGAGKSTITKTILDRFKKYGISFMSDDKVIINFNKKWVGYGNQILSSRNIINKKTLSSSYTAKNYYKINNNYIKKTKYKKIIIYNIDLNTTTETSTILTKKNSILNLYFNIINIINGNEACSIQPIGVFDNFEGRGKKILKNLIKKYHNITKCISISGSLEFIIDNILNDLEIKNSYIAK